MKKKKIKLSGGQLIDIHDTAIGKNEPKKLSELFPTFLFLTYEEEKKLYRPFYMKETNNLNVTHCTCREAACSFLSNLVANSNVVKKPQDVKIGIVVAVDKNRKRLLKNLESNFRQSIKLINIIETHHKWDKTIGDGVFRNNTISVQPGYDGKEKEYDYIGVVYKVSENWLKYTHSLSLFLLLVRMSLKGLYKGANNYEQFLECNKNLYKRDHLARTHHLWDLYLKNINKIYTKEDTSAFCRGEVSGIRGIRSLVADVWLEAKKKGELDELTKRNLVIKKHARNLIYKTHKNGIPERFLSIILDEK